MQGVSHIRPTKSRILVERLEGHGVERTTKGGIVIPATNEAKAKTKNDVFRARILAIGPDATEIQRAYEDGFEHVLVYAWNDTTKRKGLYTGVPVGRNRLLIEPDDIAIPCMPDADIDVSNSAWERS